jgi:serine/threonine-protein kinase HipA
MSFAGKLGIDVPEMRLQDLGEIAGLPSGIGSLQGKALAIKRFDRTNEGAVHIEDFAQIIGVYPNRKYEKASYRNIAHAIWIETGEDGLAEFIRRLVFNIMIGNADMHLKNWSLIYPDKVNAKIAPAYDFVSTIAFLPDETMALSFGHSKEWNDVTSDELNWFAGKAHLPQKLVMDSAKEIVEKFQQMWPKEKTNLSFGEEVVQSIENHLKKIPLVDALS